MLRLTKMGAKKLIIVSDPEIMMGKPVIAGTRITVELILEKLAAGETVEQILDSHPRLSEDAIREVQQAFSVITPGSIRIRKFNI